MKKNCYTKGLIVSFPSYYMALATYTNTKIYIYKVAWRTGSLKFRHIWRVYNTKKGLRSDCVMPLCDGPDNWEHLKVCKWYRTKWKDSYTEESEIADYLVAVNKERFDRVKLPLL